MRRWKPLSKFFFCGVLGIFFIQGVIFTLKQGNEPYMPTDGTSEQITIYAAKHFVEYGFFEHDLLPTYPPFSVDLEGKPRQHPFVYNHYLAGQDLVLGLWIKIFGENHLGLARLIPHTLTTLAMALFSLSFGYLLGSVLLTNLLLASMLFPRALITWSTCLWGHSHGTAFVLIGWALFLYLKKKPSFILLGALSAIAVCFFAIDWLPILCFGFLAFSILFSKKIGFLKGILASLGSVGGFLIAMGYQILISTLDSHSFSKTISEMGMWLSVRSQFAPKTNQTGFAADYVPQPLNRVLSELNRQAYGATGFTLSNLFVFGGIFIAMGYFSKVLTRKQAYQHILALGLGYLATISWTVVMKHHALSNMHYITRHCLAMYLITVVITLPLAVGITNAKKI